MRHLVSLICRQPGGEGSVIYAKDDKRVLDMGIGLKYKGCVDDNA